MLVQPQAGARLLRGGRVVCGGSPWRALLLDDADAAIAVRLWNGEDSAALAAPGTEVARRLVQHGLALPLAFPAGSVGAPTVDAVTLVVPVHNDALRLGAALRSVPAGIALIVVDDGSSDGSADVARAAGATVLHHEVARGPAAARNAGLRAAATPLVALLDADVEADPSWVETLLRHFADPTVAVVAPRVRGRQVEAPSLLTRYEDAMGVLDRGPDAALVGPEGPVTFVATAALLVRRQALLAIGGFDTDLQLGEDVDLCRRLYQAGAQVRYDPSAEVRHDNRTQWSSWWARRVTYGSGGPDVAKRHGSPLPAVPTAGSLAAAWFLFGPGPARRRAFLSALLLAGGIARTTVVAAHAGVPVLPAVRGATLRESSAARTTAGMLPRFALLPLSGAWALSSHRGRRAVVTLVALQHTREWWARRPRVDPIRFVALRVLEETALATGLWRACWKHRTIRPLLPRIGGPRVVRR